LAGARGLDAPRRSGKEIAVLHVRDIVRKIIQVTLSAYVGGGGVQAVRDLSVVEVAVRVLGVGRQIVGLALLA